MLFASSSEESGFPEEIRQAPLHGAELAPVRTEASVSWKVPVVNPGASPRQAWANFPATFTLTRVALLGR